MPYDGLGDALTFPDEFIRHLGEGAGVWLWSLEGATGELRIFGEVETILGVSPRTLPELMPVVHIEDAPALQAALGEAAAQGLGGQVRCRLRSPEHGWLHFHVTYSAQTNGAGGVTLFGASRDVTVEVLKTQMADEALRRAGLAESIAGVGYWRSAADGSNLEWSDNMYRLYRRDPALGPPTREEALSAIHPDDLERVKDSWRRDDLEDLEFRIVGEAGQVRHMAARKLREVNAYGAVTAQFGICMDVSAAKATEAELIQAKQAAEASTAAKSTFLATMSHEIRTPLNGILGMAQIMALGDLPAPQRERLRVLAGAGESLLLLLNDALGLSRLETGMLELERGVVDVAEIAGGARMLFEAIASDKDVSLELTLAPGAGGRRRGDALRVRQVLHNLLSNAVKFTSHGRVTIAADGDARTLVLSVSDTGPGIAEADRQRVFERFVQLDASNTRRHGGSGLGLAICAELVAAMNGSIGLDSVVGQGSTFTVRLPMPRLA